MSDHLAAGELGGVVVLVRLDLSAVSARRARTVVREVAQASGRDDLVNDATSVVSELVSNAVLHARTDITLQVDLAGAGLRIEVSDGSPILPHWSPALASATCGRGLLMVERLATAWGVLAQHTGGKTIWAQLDHAAVVEDDISPEQELDRWAERAREPVVDLTAIAVVLVDLDVGQMLESRAHTEDLVRQLHLSLLQAGSPYASGSVPEHIVRLANRVITATVALHDVRDQLWSGALRAAQQGQLRTTLHLTLHPGDADAARTWLWALDEADELANSAQLYLPPFAPELTTFRRAYVYDLADQVDAACARKAPRHIGEPGV